MIVLNGQPALSAFRIDRLNSELARHAPGCVVRAAHFVYFVDADTAKLDIAKLCEVIQASPEAPEEPALLLPEEKPLVPLDDDISPLVFG